MPYTLPDGSTVATPENAPTANNPTLERIAALSAGPSDRVDAESNVADLRQQLADAISMPAEGRREVIGALLAMLDSAEQQLADLAATSE